MTTTPLQLQTIWYLSNDMILILTATLWRLSVTSLPSIVEQCSLWEGKGFDSSCQIDGQIDGQFLALCFSAILFLIFQDFDIKT